MNENTPAPVIVNMKPKANRQSQKSESSHIDPVQAAIDYGIDVSMLIDNLQRSVTERVKRHQIALNTVKRLRKERTLLTDDFDNMFERSVDYGVDFVVVGDFAGVVYGCTYVNQGIESCCDFSPDNLLRLQRAVSGLEPVYRMAPNRRKLELMEETCSDFKNLYLDTKEGPLDCLSVIDGLGDYRQAEQQSELVEIEGAKIRVLNLEALIQTKRVMNRPRDKEAISQLEAIRELRKR